MKNAIERLVQAIGYPERVSEGALSFDLTVDGAKVSASEEGDRIILAYALDADDSMLTALASYSAGRMLKEEAVLSWENGAFLWQDAPYGAGAQELRRLFETFMDSCDWWRARVDALRGGESGSAAMDEAMMIRP